MAAEGSCSGDHEETGRAPPALSNVIVPQMWASLFLSPYSCFSGVVAERNCIVRV